MNLPSQKTTVRKLMLLGHYNIIQHLRSLHTQAKSSDHEIVRAQKKVSKGRPKTAPKSANMVTDFQV